MRTSIETTKTYTINLSEADKQQMCGEIRRLDGCPVLSAILTSLEKEV